ncbi:hypothetical protein ACE1AT_08300, partial [Pelatocladus sp. BLCC-F211]|uniref:hypothetical protein n=1 Tax=Pelatocladus sp. BLCC-F211 TaxID=3342752 RepID=UPI0035B9A006
FLWCKKAGIWMWIIYLFSGYLIVQILMSAFSVYVVYPCYLLKCGMWDKRFSNSFMLLINVK